MKKAQNSQINEKMVSLKKLQREYLSNAISKLDEMIALSQELQTFDDETMIRAYCAKIDALDAQVEKDYGIACEIEKVIK